jgi:hypothetical protein
MAELTGERQPCKDRSLPFQQTVNVLHTEEGLRLALLYKRIYTNKKVLSILLAQCLPCIGLVYFCKTTGIPKVWQLPYFSNK